VKDVYIDTSAYFKLFIEEAHDVVERIILLKRKEDTDHFIQLGNNEVFALVDENRRKGRIDKIQTQNILLEIIMDMIEAHVEYGNYVLFNNQKHCC
jgi:predicted nucleic acid-binding protein